jgi:methyl-accepting chemotaxis protein
MPVFWSNRHYPFDPLSSILFSKQIIERHNVVVSLHRKVRQFFLSAICVIADFSPEASMMIAPNCLSGKEFPMDARLLRSSFDLIASDKDQFAEAFYQRLFEKYPQTRSFFANTDMAVQARTLAATLTLVVAGVERGDNLTPTLQSLGARHKTYGVLPEHYPIVGEILIETFQNRLGSQWTPAFQNAWLQAFSTIAQVMSAESVEKSIP